MESGYFYVLAGVNGSGKTTLLDCISGVSQGFSGETQIDGISFKASPVLYRQKLGYISEKCPFFMEESVASNGLTYGEFYPDWSVRDYSAYLDRLNVSPSKRIYELSKGEFMKLQICFSLAHHPDFLILDEPLEGFDPVFRHEFLSLLGELLDQDMGILLSTHITEDVDRLADYLLILENGRLVECAPRESLNDKYKEYTGKAAPRIRDLLDLEHTNGTRSKDR
jgi:ABC-2 type transport system ATP-binding protein